MASFFAVFFFFIGLPQHQRVVLETPQQPTTTSLPQGAHTNLSPFLILAIVLPLFRIN
jgi:hypothetical protein